LLLLIIFFILFGGFSFEESIFGLPNQSNIEKISKSKDNPKIINSVELKFIGLIFLQYKTAQNCSVISFFSIRESKLSVKRINYPTS